MRLRGLLFDLDDTVLDHGVLSRSAFEALHALADSGLLLYGVTGRPVGWAQVLVRQWPIAGMVAENGAVAIVKSEHGLRLKDRLSTTERAERRGELDRLCAAMMLRFPELEPSDLGLGRLSDMAFDVAEQRNVHPETVRAASAFAEQRGARTSLSSIHLHATFDVDDKATGTLRVLDGIEGFDPGASRTAFAFIGDSGNDSAAFSAFKTTIGVANLKGRMTMPPRYITEHARGAGFSEAARVILERRRTPGQKRMW